MVMCVVSMIMDHYWDKWQPKPTPPWPTYPIMPPMPDPYKVYKPVPTQEEIDEFRKLLERAREYDKKHSEPECELEEKKAKVRKLAEELGVDVSFI